MTDPQTTDNDSSGQQAPPPTGPANVPTVMVDEGATRRLQAGHVWVYRNQILRGAPAEAAFVRVTGSRGRLLGHATYSARSTIALRLMTTEERPIDAALIAERLRSALARRRRLAGSATPLPDAFRLVHAEADGLPAIIVDVYGSHLVVQTLTHAAEMLLPALDAALVELLAPESILLRNDPAVRELEGLPREIKQLRGQTPTQVPVREGAIHLLVDPHHGHKTGMFLDQRQNRLRVAQLGCRRVLDCFCYDGGFALQAALRATEVTAIDVSGEAIARARRNAERNGITCIRYVEGNSFDLLREYASQGQTFDLVILDPPAFAKNRGAVEGALRGYKEINLRALKLLEPGGFLVSSSCSYHLSEALFGELLHAAAADAHREVHLVERRGQATDHPVLLGTPETAYLKCWILSVDGRLPGGGRGRQHRPSRAPKPSERA